MIDLLCEICGRTAVVVWKYITTSGSLLDKSPLCENHSGEKKDFKNGHV